MVNGSPFLRDRFRNIYLPRSAVNSLAAELLLGRTPLIDDDDDEGMIGLSRFNPSRIPRSGTLVYNDAHGNINEVSYGVGGRLHHSIRRNGLMTRSVGEEPTSAPSGPVQNNRSPSFGLDGREPENFNTGFLTLEDPFSGFGRRSILSGLGRHGDRGILGDYPEERLPYGGAFAAAAFTAAMEDTLMPYGTGVPGMTAQAAAGFIQRHTQPITDDDANKSPNTECPICLEPPSSTHSCVQITNIPGCTHLIGRECLEELLTHSARSKKVCPLCRTEWVGADGIWQMSGEWERILMDLDDSPHRLQGLGEFDGSPRDRLAGHGMGSLRPPHDNLRRDDRRPEGPPPAYNPEACSPSAGRGGRTRTSG